MAFQVVDDLLDVEGDPDAVGKTLGLDLARGKLTLPIIRWLETLPPPQRAAATARLRAAGDAGQARGGRIAEALREEILDSAGPASARQRAAFMASAAAEELRQALPAGVPRDRLLHLADSLLERRH